MFRGVLSSLWIVAALGHRRFEEAEALGLEEATGLSDVTDLIRDYDALRMGRCCCDVSSRSWVPGSAPAECELFLGHAGQCGDLTEAQRSRWGGRRLSHYPRNHGECRVSRRHRDDVSAQVEDSMGDLTDVTLLASTLEPAGRCCCDIGEKSESAEAAARRSHRCSIFFLEGSHCKDITAGQVRRHYLHSGGRELNNYRNTEAGKCFVNTATLDSQAKIALETASTFHAGPGGYCRSVELEEEGSFTGTARMGEDVQVTCPLGQRSAFIVQCGYASLTEGSLSPPPRCEPVPDFCAEVAEVAGGAAMLGEERQVTCSSGMFPEVGRTTCGADGFFEPAPMCVPECITLPTFVAGKCAGPSLNLGACYTSQTQMKRWLCWDVMTDARSQTNEECRLSGFEGACIFGDHNADSAAILEYHQCHSLDFYRSQCGENPAAHYKGACYMEGAQTADGAHWGCIERGGGFELADCRATPLPLDLILESRQMTYSGACRFS